MNGTKRHPVRGFFAGLLAGLGIAVLTVLTSVFALGGTEPYIIVVVGVVAGVAWAMLGPVRQRKGGATPAAATAPAAGKGPMPE